MIGAILAISTLGGIARKFGLSISSIPKGLEDLFSVHGVGGLFRDFTLGASVNVYFEYSQENDFKASKLDF